MSENFEKNFDESEGVEIGQKIIYKKLISESDVEDFAKLTGDENPIHLDSDVAQDSMFGERICHGILVGGLISACLAKYNGTVIYLSQKFEFTKPVPVDSEVVVNTTIVDENDSQYTVETIAEVSEDIVIKGEATILVR